MTSRCHRILHYKISMITFSKICTGGKHLQIQLPTMVRTGLIKITIAFVTWIKTRTCFKIKWDQYNWILPRIEEGRLAKIPSIHRQGHQSWTSRWKLKMNNWEIKVIDREELMRMATLANRIYHRIFQKRRVNNRIRCLKCRRRRLTSCLDWINMAASIDMITVLNLKYLIPI